MKMAAKKTKFTGATEQKLPGANSSASGGTQGAPVRGISFRPPNFTGKPDTDARFLNSAPAATVAAPAKTATPHWSSNPPAPVINIAAADTASEAPTLRAEASTEVVAGPLPSDSANRFALDCARELISAATLRLRGIGTDQLNVVIKPDAGTQLSLNLKVSPGNSPDAAARDSFAANPRVEVQAVLDRGNFNFLSRHWPDLQQQLQAQGVRVAALACSNDFGGGSEGFRQPTPPPGHQDQEDADSAVSPVTLIPNLPTATATASASISSSRRLETWA